MTRTESIVACIVIGLLCPLLLFILCWWITAALAFLLPVSESWIAIAALTGLAVGMSLDVLYHRKWIPYFYSVDVKLLVLVYLFCSAAATAFCMGLPLGNVVLGTMAGAYAGRRAYHSTQNRESFSRTANWVSLFAALVTGAWALWIGLLALDEEIVIGSLRKFVGLGRATIAGPVGVGLMVLMCIVLMALQYWCTRAGAWMMFRLGGTGVSDQYFLRSPCRLYLGEHLLMLARLTRSSGLVR